MNFSEAGFARPVMAACVSIVLSPSPFNQPLLCPLSSMHSERWPR